MRANSPLLALMFLFVFSGEACAQTNSGIVNHSLKQIENYYRLYGPSRLVEAQIILREYGTYDGPLDGKWGAGTVSAFQNVIETRIAIGGEQWGAVYGPDGVMTTLDWVGAVILAKGGYGDMPD